VRARVAVEALAEHLEHVGADDLAARVLDDLAGVAPRTVVPLIGLVSSQRRRSIVA
jgi:hypothetical protein